MQGLLRGLALGYGLVAALVFGATAIYAVGFIANLGLPNPPDAAALVRQAAGGS